MGFNFLIPLRAAQVVVAITILGLNAYVANWWTGHWHQPTPAETSFLIFSCVWTFLAMAAIHLGINRMPASSMRTVITIVAEAATMVFWLAGWISETAFLTDRICFGMVCNVAKAGTGLAAFEWVLFAGSTFWQLILLRKAKNPYGEKQGKVEMHQGV